MICPSCGADSPSLFHCTSCGYDIREHHHKPYLDYLYAKLKEALDIQDGYRTKPDGELKSSSMAREWGKKAMEIQAEIQKSRDEPDAFTEEACIWEKRMAYPIH